MISKFDLKKYLVPGDTIYIVVIVLGLFFLVFLGDLPVRLIGACIALLSGVVLVMNLSARLKDQVEVRRPAPSQSVELSVKVKKDASGTRYVFDDFESNFGGDDGPLLRSEENMSSAEAKRLRFDDTDASADKVVLTRRASPYSTDIQRSTSDEVTADFSDEISGMRIKSRRALTQEQPVAERSASPEQSSSTKTKGSAYKTRTSAYTLSSLPNEKSSTESEEPPVDVAVHAALTEQRTAHEAESLTESATHKTQTSSSSQQAQASESDQRKSEQDKKAEAAKTALNSSGAHATVATESDAVVTLKTDAVKADAAKPEMKRLVFDESGEVHLKTEQGERVIEAEEVMTVVPLAALTSDVQAHSPTKEVLQSPLPSPVKEFDAAESSRQRQLLLALGNLIDDAEHPSDEEPRKEFDYLLSRVLMVIRSIMNARTAAFFWVNLEQEELVLETRITDAPDLFRNQRKYPLGLDMVSQIAKSGRPEILTEIKQSAQADLIPYYSQPAGTTSFVGVPVFLNHTVIGVLCADSTQDDAYDEITIGSLGHFTKLISGLTQSYTGKYDLLQSSRTLEALAHFRTLVNTPGASMHTIAAALVESSSSIVESQTIGAVLFDRETERWTIHTLSSSLSINDALKGEEIDTAASLISKTIFKGTTTCVSPVPQGTNRYHSREQDLENGFFVAVPLKSTSSCYGALFVEGHASQLTQRDISILETIGEQTGVILEQIHFQKMLKKSALLDESTGLLNSAAFISRLDEEIFRARDNKVPLVLTLISIDRYNAVENQLSHSEKEELFMHVLSLIRKYVRSYDALGRLDENIIGVVLPGSRDNESQLWAERLRKEVAISVKEIKKKRYTVTVSIGLAKAVADDNAESLLTSAGRAMEIASTKTNNVVVFS